MSIMDKLSPLIALVIVVFCFSNSDAVNSISQFISDNSGKLLIGLLIFSALGQWITYRGYRVYLHGWRIWKTSDLESTLQRRWCKRDW